MVGIVPPAAYYPSQSATSSHPSLSNSSIWEEECSSARGQLHIQSCSSVLSTLPFQHIITKFPHSLQFFYDPPDQNSSLAIDRRWLRFLPHFFYYLSPQTRTPQSSIHTFEHSSDRQSCHQTAVASLSSPFPDNHQVSLDKQQTQVSQRLYEPPEKRRIVLPNRPPVQIPPTLPKLPRSQEVMDAYPGYREPPIARSPPERTTWGGRDDGYRTTDRAESRDNFYRGRSPGMFTLFLRDTRWPRRTVARLLLGRVQLRGWRLRHTYILT